MASRVRDAERRGGNTRAPLLVRVEETARLLGISRSKVYMLIASGELPSVLIGRSRRVPVDALQRWIAERAA